MGKRRFEVADTAVSAFYRAEAAIAHARQPAAAPGEGSTRKRGDNELAAFRGLLDRLYVPVGRLKHYSGAFDELERAAVNVEVHFGSELADAIREPLRAYEKIAIATACRMGRVGLSIQVEVSPTLVQQWAAVVNSSESCNVGAEDADQISAEMIAAKRSIETVLRPHLEVLSFSEFMAPRRLRALVTSHVRRLVVRRRHRVRENRRVRSGATHLTMATRGECPAGRRGNVDRSSFGKKEQRGRLQLARLVRELTADP